MSDPATTSPEYDWGGDGSDLNHPVRAHVEAALLQNAAPFATPVDALLRLGSPLERSDLPEQIASLGLTNADVPELVRLLHDRELNTRTDESDELWGPINALEALKGLDARPAVKQIVQMFDVDSEWYGEELPDVLRHTGSEGLEAVGAYVGDTSRWIWGRCYAGSAITAIAEEQPELRDRAVTLLSLALDYAAKNSPEVNGSLIAELLRLDAVEALPSIRRAYEADAVDMAIVGDWIDVLTELDQPIDPEDPLIIQSEVRLAAEREHHHHHHHDHHHDDDAFAPAATPKKQSAGTRKAKRKASSASRKQNKKKKKKK